MTTIISSALGAGGALVIGLGLWWMLFRPRGRGTGRSPATSILLRRGKVVDATPGADQILGAPFITGLGWDSLRDALRQQFPDLPDNMPDQPSQLEFTGTTGLRLTLRRSGETLLLRLEAHDMVPARLFHLETRAAKCQHFADILDRLPQPAWHVGPDGDVTWHNVAFARLCTACNHDPAHPLPFEPEPRSDTGTPPRVSVLDATKERHWFELESFAQDDGRLHVATDIGNLVAAERAQRQFVQTLSKTFAHLPIGLAAFGADQRLALFNPALVDLTRLNADFLSARPTLRSFFDLLRENRMMPEPKNYASWRERLSEMISAAQDDRFCETWTLETGLTYKITGRPHPDGAVAFLFEDISAEISLTRRFRAELMVTQSVVDSFEDAIAVFSQNGVLNFCNARYNELWRDQRGSAASDTNIVDAARIWQQACQGGPDWRHFRDLTLDPEQRRPWQTGLMLGDGTELLCRVVPVAGGATMVRFSRCDAHIAALPASRSARG